MVLVYAVVLAFGGGAWLQVTQPRPVHLHHPHAASPVFVWLRDSTLALPLILVALTVVLLLRRPVVRLRRGDTAAETGPVLAAAAAAGVGTVVSAFGVAAFPRVFGTGLAILPTPPNWFVLQSGLQVLRADLLLATAVAIVAARVAPRLTQR